MKIWTYQEAKNKIITDLDLEDEKFISPNELIGYFNEALTESEAEIQAMNQDYFLTKAFVPVVQGTKTYDLPENIFANKIRGLYYLNGSINYPIGQPRRKNKFENIELTDVYAPSADYCYLLVNNFVGQAKIQFHPTMRDTAIMPPLPGAFTPIVLWYIRNCARVPLIGEFCNQEVLAPSQVSTGSSEITVNSGSKTVIGIPSQGVVGAYPGSIPYVTGDKIRVKANANSTLPGGLSADTDYFVIAVSPTIIKVAATLMDAFAGTNITLTTAGTGSFSIYVAATENIVNATLLDIPEFTTFVIQWVKCRCMEKEGDPRYKDATEVLIALKKSMIDTLTEGIQDDDNEIQADFSYYNELS